MTRKAKSTAPGDAEVKRLLMRYQCPVPFHAVRTRFLGSIASPELRVAPMEVLQDLWDGETPEFETIDDANELFAALIQGLWNRLTRHQDRKTPFRLTRLRSPINSKELKHFAQVRLDDVLVLPEGCPPHRSVHPAGADRQDPYVLAGVV